jgi:hypothetical protein
MDRVGVEPTTSALLGFSYISKGAATMERRLTDCSNPPSPLLSN